MKTLLFAFVWLATASASFADRPAIHGMLLFGKTTSYASHLPMYHSPHDYQAIFQLNLQVHPSDPTTLEKYEKAKGTQTLFTLVPEERMDLSKVIDGSIKTFPAQIYEGHFERGGRQIGKIMVQVSKTLMHSKLRTDAGPSSDFIVFGQQGEYFAAHIIKGNSEQPTYDAVMSSSQPYRFHQPPCGRASCPKPTKVVIDDSKLPVTVAGEDDHVSKAPEAGEILGLQTNPVVEIKKVIYFETDDLKMQ